EGEVRHVRVEGLLAPATHASTQILFGYETAPSTNNPAVELGQFKALFYGGGTPEPTPQLMALFEDHVGVLSEDATFLHAVSTVCFDVHHGGDDSPPHLIVWLDGQNGADCQDFSTLSLETSYARELWWEGMAEGSINAGLPVYFRQAAQQEAIVTLFGEPAVAEEELLPHSCSTEISAETNTFVELCATDQPARHVKIEGLVAPATHASTQVLFGFESPPSASPSTLADDQFQVLFYGGGSPAPSPVAQVKWGAASRSFSEEAAFMHSTVTVCMDV